MRTLTTPQNSKTRLVSAFAILLSLFLSSSLAKAAIIPVNSNTTWSSLTGGSGAGGTPNSSDDIRIKDGVTLQVNVANAVCNNLVIGNNTTGAGADAMLEFISTGVGTDPQLTVTGNISKNQKKASDLSIVKFTVTGKLICNSFINTGIGTFSFTKGTGTVEVTGTNTLPTTINDFHNLTISGATTLSTAITISGNLSVKNTFTASTFDVTMNGTANQVIDGTAATVTFNNLNINTTGVLSANRNISINSGKSLNVNSGATFTPGAANTLGGAGTITGAGIAVVTLSGSNSFTTQYSIANKALTNLTLDFTGSSAQTVTNTLTGLKSLTVSNTAGVTFNSNVALNVSTGIFTVNLGAIATVGSGNTMSGATLTGTGTIVVTKTGTDPFTSQYTGFTTRTLTNLTLNYTGSSAQTETNALAGLKNLIVSNTAGTTFDNNITISGNLTVSPSAIVKVTYGKKLTGSTLVGSGRVIVTQTGSATDDLTTQYALTLSTSTLAIEFAGTSVAQKTAYSPFSDLIITNATTLGANTVITGNLTLNNTFTTTGYTVTMNGASTQTISGSATPSFNNLVVSNATTLGSNITVAGDLTLNNTFTTTGKTITINGSGNQAINGSSSLSFNSLIINKSAGSLNLGKSASVNSLTLTSGNVALGSFDLTITGSITGGTASSYVKADGAGRLNATVASGSTKLFPIGSSAAFLPVSITIPGAASNTVFQAGVKDGVVNSSGTSITDHIVNATWNVSPTTSVNNASLLFGWNSAASNYDATKSFIVSRANTGSSWAAVAPLTIPNGTNVSSSSNGVSSFTQSTPALNFSGDALYSVGDATDPFVSAVPLPVELISFTANKVNDVQAKLDWSTAWEVNNRGFEIERSTNGVYWTNIGFVAGNGNSNQLLNYSFPTSLAGINSSLVYYRLKQVDFNGKFEYSPVRTIRLNGAAAKVEGIYPNPATNKISISLGAVETGQVAKVTIMDMTGKVIMTSEQIIEAGNTALDMNVDNLKKGNYIVNISSANTSYNTKLIKL